MDQQRILELFNKHWAAACLKHKIDYHSKPQVEFYNTGTIAGKANRFGKYVKYNTEIARVAGETFENTIIHEIAHIVTFKLYPKSQPHGKEWKNIFIGLGGNGKRCSEYDLSESSVMKNRIPAKCSCQTHMLTKQRVNKMQLGVTYSCLECKTKLTLVSV